MSKDCLKHGVEGRVKCVSGRSNKMCLMVLGQDREALLVNRDKLSTDVVKKEIS